MRRLTFSAVAVAAAMIASCAFSALADATPRFTEANLDALLDRNPNTGKPVDSIAELLPLLPPEFRSNFTFAFDSRSPFRKVISPDHPRVVLFSDDGRLVLTFTGEVNRPGADVLETMSFDDERQSFIFKVRELPAAKRAGLALPPDAANCGRCHGADPRPIYDSYPVWPGFYGSTRDTFLPDSAGRKELTNYLRFLATTAKTGVYSELAFRSNNPTTPFIEPSKVHDGATEANETLLQFAPNTRLGMALTELNRQRIYRKLAAGAAFAQNEKRILRTLLACRPDDAPSAAEQAAVKAELRAENADRLKRLGISPGQKPGLRAMVELDYVEDIAAVDRAARLAGVNREDWAMGIDRNSLSFFDGILSGIHENKSYYFKEDLIYELLRHLAARDPTFRPYFRPYSAYPAMGYPFAHRIDLGVALKSCARLDDPVRESLR